MKKLLIATWFLLLLFPAVQAQSDPNLKDRGLPPKETQVLDVLNHRISALLKNDFAALDALLDDSLLYAHSSGRVDTKASFLDSLRSGQLKYVAASLDDLRVRIYGSTALVTGRSRMTVESAGQQRHLDLRFLDVYVHRNDRWRQVSWQSTRIQEQ